MPRLRKGMEVRIEFEDHVEDDDKLIRFFVYGRLAEFDKQKIVVESWCYVDDKETDKLNVKRFSIVRSAIVRGGIKQLGE